MSIDPRTFIDNDKRLPSDLTGEQGKVLKVNAAEDAYELAAESTSALTGQVIMWMFDSPPPGYLMVGHSYYYDDYPALGALFGADVGETFDVPAINFPKGSGGIDTGTEEAEGVGTHGHGDTSAGNSHNHTVSITSVGAHQHLIQVEDESGVGALPGVQSAPETWDGDGYKLSSAAGAHTHTASSGVVAAHSHSITEHTGVNQPACTLINFCIKT